MINFAAVNVNYSLLIEIQNTFEKMGIMHFIQFCKLKNDSPQ